MPRTTSTPQMTPVMEKRLSVSLRVSEDLYERIKAAAAASGRSMAGEMAYRLDKQYDADRAVRSVLGS